MRRGAAQIACVLDHWPLNLDAKTNQPATSSQGHACRSGRDMWRRNLNGSHLSANDRDTGGTP